VYFVPRGALHSIPSPDRLRWVVASATLAAEIIWLTAVFHAPDAAAASHWSWKAVLTVFNNGYHYTAAIIFSATLFLAASPNLDAILKALRNPPGYRWSVWVVLHSLAFLVFVLVTSAAFGARPDDSARSVFVLASWVTAGSATLIFWLLVLAPAAAWFRVLREQQLNIFIGFLAGAATWLVGLLAQNLWEPLAGGTLRLSALLLSLIYPEVVYDPTQGLVGTRTYFVEIYPVCSGYEGITLVTVFVATYLWIFRKELPFPKAFVLFPIGIGSIWLANVLRITTLIAVGTSGSSEVASGGFHSQAGWIGFTLVALGLIAISHRWLSSARLARPPAAVGSRPEVVLLTPLLVLMATSMVVAAASSGFDAFYPLGVITTGAILWYHRTSYRALFGCWSWEPLALGTLVFVIWVFLLPGSARDSQVLADRLTGLPPWLATVWILFRLLGSVVTVPLAEELAFRGYLIRKLVAKDFEKVRPGHFTWFSFITSSLLFGFLHQHWLAGAIAGAAFALALYRRGRVGDAIIAHMTSNALIGLAVLGAGHWRYWT